MDNETLQIIAQFLSRVDLKGSEVQAFNKVMLEITGMAELNNMAAVVDEEVPEDCVSDDVTAPSQ